MKERDGEVRVRPGDRGNWRRRRNAGRSANIEMDVLDARFTSIIIIYILLLFFTIQISQVQAIKE